MGLKKVKSQKLPARNASQSSACVAGGKVKSHEEKRKRVIELKMSKSNPDNAIFMTDSLDEIKRKINKAWCPEGEAKENPVLEYCQYILFESFDKLGIDSLIIERPKKHGGTIKVKSYSELVKLFEQKKVHPQDLKQTVTLLLDKLLQPIRLHFKKNKKAAHLLKKVQSFQVMR